MRWRSTFWLVGIAFGLLAYIWFAERHALSTADRQASQRLLPEFRVLEMDTVQVQRTNSFVLQVQRTNDGWEYLAPFSYPAQKLAVHSLLEYIQTENMGSVLKVGE